VERCERARIQIPRIVNAEETRTGWRKHLYLAGMERAEKYVRIESVRWAGMA